MQSGLRSARRFFIHGVSKSHVPQGTEDVTPEADLQVAHGGTHCTGNRGEASASTKTRIPTFESTDLFLRSVGETTDVVQKEMYTVTAKETEFTLRPEGTAGTIRSMLQNGSAERCPAPEGVSISCPASATKRPPAKGTAAGVPPVRRGNGQAARDRLLTRRSLRWQRPFSTVPDSQNIVPETSTPSAAPPAVRNITRLCGRILNRKRTSCARPASTRLEKNPMRILDCKSPELRRNRQGCPVILDYLCDDCRDTLRKAPGIPDGPEHRLHASTRRSCRGLDYYTKTVFEFVTTDIGAQGTVCGGGRYDGRADRTDGRQAAPRQWDLPWGLERLITAQWNSQGRCLRGAEGLRPLHCPHGRKRRACRQCSWDSSSGFPAIRLNTM